MNEAHELAHPFVDVIVLQLNEASADGSNVALLIGEGHTTSSLWVFELRVGVDASVANTSVQPVHDHSQLHWKERRVRTMISVNSKSSQVFLPVNDLLFLISKPSASLKKPREKVELRHL